MFILHSLPKACEKSRSSLRSVRHSGCFLCSASNSHHQMTRLYCRKLQPPLPPSHHRENSVKRVLLGVCACPTRISPLLRVVAHILSAISRRRTNERTGEAIVGEGGGGVRSFLQAFARYLNARISEGSPVRPSFLPSHSFAHSERRKSSGACASRSFGWFF